MDNESEARDVYQVGDVVRYVSVCDGNIAKLNKTAVVVHAAYVRATNNITIQFDEAFSGGHDGLDHSGKFGYCWNVEPHHIKLVKSVDPEKAFVLRWKNG